MCSAGTYSDGKTFECTTCPTGTYSSAGSSKCTDCLGTGVSACDSKNGKATKCNAGYGLSNGTCTKCSAGYYSAGGTASCTKCPAGSYSSAGAGSCTLCSVGYYSSSTGSTSCSSCNPSTTSGGSGCGRKSVSTTSYCTVSGSTSATANPKTTSSYETLTCSSGYVCISGSCEKSTTRSLGCYKTDSHNSVTSTGGVSVTLGSRVPSCSPGYPTIGNPWYADITSCSEHPSTSTYKYCKSVAGKYWCGGDTFKDYPCN